MLAVGATRRWVTSRGFVDALELYAVMASIKLGDMFHFYPFY